MKLLEAVCLVAASLVPVGAQEIYKVGNGVSAPIVIKEVRPEYTQDAKKARIEGDVQLYVVVRADGRVGDVKVARSLDSTFGLDQQAVNAAKAWIFKPGLKNGKPVAVQVILQLTFTLK
jgi:TonB family protein